MEFLFNMVHAATLQLSTCKQLSIAGMTVLYKFDKNDLMPVIICTMISIFIM